MSSTSTSLPQATANVNTRYYSAQLNARTRAAAARVRRTPEQIQAENEHAAKLRAQDAILLAGPVEVGNVITIPSWRWNPELVRAIKAFPGWHFEKELPYTVRVTLHHHDYTTTITMPTWTIPAERTPGTSQGHGRLEAIRAVYEQVFAREISVARTSAGLTPLGRF